LSNEEREHPHYKMTVNQLLRVLGDEANRCPSVAQSGALCYRPIGHLIEAEDSAGRRLPPWSDQRKHAGLTPNTNDVELWFDEEARPL
jgi:hypothetical protein